MDEVVVVDCSVSEAETRPATSEEEAQAAIDQAALAEQETADLEAQELLNQDAAGLRDETTRLQALDDATTTKAAWDALTPGQRQEATRQAIRVLLRLTRFVVRRLL